MANFKLNYTGEQVNTAIGNALNGSGGGQLYAHNIHFGNNESSGLNAQIVCTVYNQSPEPITWNYILNNFLSNNKDYFYCMGYAKNSSSSTVYQVFCLHNSNGTIQLQGRNTTATTDINVYTIIGSYTKNSFISDIVKAL